MKVVMDSDVLIKLTKAGLKETIVNLLEVFIPKRVQEETVMESKSYPDSNTIQGNIDSGKIHVAAPSKHDKGELEVLNLYSSGGFESIASDDRKFLNYLERNNIPYLTSSSLIVYLLYAKRISKEDTIKYIDSLKMYISKMQYVTAMSEVLRWEM